MANVNVKLADRLVFASIKLTRWLRTEDPAPTLSGPQASALALIVYSGKIKPSELAELEEVKRPTIARTIGQLADKKLINRVSDPRDARSVFLEPTIAGIKVIHEGQRRRIEPLRVALTKISPKDRQTIEKALPIIEQLMDD